MSVIIEAQHLKKTYTSAFRRNKTHALRGVSLNVHEGDTFGLIGLNGAGKTTFIKTILSVVRADSGSLRVLGGSPEEPRVRAQIGYLPERLDLPKMFTAKDFMRSVGRLKGVKRVDAESMTLLERLGLSFQSRQRIGGFSKGMRQRLGLAAALLGRPRLLVLDEPTDGIDPIGRSEIRGILYSEKMTQGTTIFLNSHLLSETERLADKIAIIAHGEVIEEGRLEELCVHKSRWEVTVRPSLHTEQLLREHGFNSVTGAEDNHWQIACKDEQAMNWLIAALIAKGVVFEEFYHPVERLEDVLSNSLKRDGE